MSTPETVLHQNLAKAKTPAQHVIPLLSFYESCESNVDGFIAAKNPEIACRSGCTFCCYLRVHVRAHEVFAIVDFVERVFKPTERKELLDRLQQHAKAVRSLSVSEHHARNIACPFLVNGQCSIRAARPFACRSYFSASVPHCKYSFDHPEDTKATRPRSVPLEQLWEYMSGAADRAYTQQGYDQQVCELGEACLVALNSGKHQKRWRQKKSALLRLS